MLLKPSLSNDGLPHYMKMWPKMRMYNKGTGGRCTLNDDQVGVQRILPLDYSTMHLPPLVGICQENVEACSQIAVFTPQQPHSGSLEKWKGQLSSCLVMSKNTASWDPECFPSGGATRSLAQSGSNAAPAPPTPRVR